MEETENCLKDIIRLREQMYSLYLQDNRVSDAVLNTSNILDKHIYTYMKKAEEE